MQLDLFLHLLFSRTLVGTCLTVQFSTRLAKGFLGDVPLSAANRAMYPEICQEYVNCPRVDMFQFPLRFPFGMHMYKRNLAHARDRAWPVAQIHLLRSHFVCVMYGATDANFWRCMFASACGSTRTSPPWSFLSVTGTLFQRFALLRSCSARHFVPGSV